MAGVHSDHKSAQQLQLGALDTSVRSQMAQLADGQEAGHASLRGMVDNHKEHDSALESSSSSKTKRLQVVIAKLDAAA
jgi:hypothetical protein